MNLQFVGKNRNNSARHGTGRGAGPARLAALLYAALAASCGSDPVFDLTPAITEVAIAPAQARALQDSIVISLTFTDGDGDLGGASTQGTSYVVITDSRGQSNPAVFPDSIARKLFTFPSLTPDTRNPSIQGTMSVTLPKTGVLLTPGMGLREEFVTYSVQLIDRAQRASNVLVSAPVRVYF